MTRCARGRSAPWVLLFLLYCAPGLSALESIAVSVTALGGSPLTLRVGIEVAPTAGLPDAVGPAPTAGPVHSHHGAVIVESGNFRQERHFPDGIIPETFSFPVAPFTEPGAHDLTITVVTDTGRQARFTHRVAFVDYVWGRDNFSFANDSRYRGDVDSYSELLFPWLSGRFGPVPWQDRAVILLSAYEILRGQLGLCYAFSGTAVLYHRYPETLPRFSDTTYEVREANRVVREEMAFRQNDIVFDRFVARRVSPEPQSHHEVFTELETVRAGIDQGEPVVIGILAPERHHSMVAYGYVEDLQSREVTVIAANNWDRNEEDNVSNASVENIVLLGEEPIRWPLARHAPYRDPTHLVAVEMEREYSHDRSILDRLVAHRREELDRAGRRTLLLEGVRNVRFTDLPDPGEEKPPAITRINNNMIVDVPGTGRYELEITALEDGGDFTAAWLYRFAGGRASSYILEFPEERRRLVLP